MSSFLAVIKPVSFNQFIRTGALDFKRFSRYVSPSIGDVVFVAVVGEDVAYGPFYILKSEVKSYSFKDVPSILCESRGKIEAIDIWDEASNESAIKEWEYTGYFDVNLYASVTGNLELDGLLYNSYYDKKVKMHYVFFTSAEKSLVDYYRQMLNDEGLECFPDNKGRLYVNSNVCTRCMALNLQECLSCLPFVQGFLATQIMAGRPLEAILADTPMELQKMVILPDDCEYPVGRLDGCGVIVTDNSYGINRVSGLSVRLHPFNKLACAQSEVESNILGSVGLDQYKFEASAIVVRSMFRLCGYALNNMGLDSFEIQKNGVSSHILIIKDSDDVASYASFFDDHCDDGYLIILNNSQDNYLKLARVRDIGSSSNNIKEGMYLFQNLETNTLVPLSKTLVSELRHKIHLIWES